MCVCIYLLADSSAVIVHVFLSHLLSGEWGGGGQHSPGTWQRYVAHATCMCSMISESKVCVCVCVFVMFV